MKAPIVAARAFGVRTGRPRSARIGAWAVGAVLSCLAISGCNGTETPVGSPAPATQPETAATVLPDLSGARRVTDRDVLAFGWLPGTGDPYYLAAEGAAQIWYAYDPVGQKTAQIDAPFPAVTDEAMARLGEEGKVFVLKVGLSPDGQTILYERRPADFATPGPATSVPDYVPPSELWMADGQGNNRTRLEASFAYLCGSLSSELEWRQGGSLVLGSCVPNLGTPGHFLLDVRARKYWLVNPVDANGTPLVALQADLSHDGATLVFADGSGALWLLAAKDALQAGAPTAQATRLYSPASEGGRTLYPQWSEDDQWVYAWHRSAEVSAQGLATLDLIRFPLQGQQPQEALSAGGLSRDLGAGLYQALLAIDPLPIQWSPAPDGREVLLALGQQAGPGLAGLWLLPLLGS